MLNKSNIYSQSRPNIRQRGVSLVEVLVALIVISVGMLGVASLYVSTLQAKTTSQSRMKAVNFAYDMADRIRANSTAGTAYVLTATGATPAQNCVTVDCSAAQMAAADLDAWDAMVTDVNHGLPGVTRTITRTALSATAPEFFTITLTWTEPNTTAALSFELQVRV